MSIIDLKMKLYEVYVQHKRSTLFSHAFNNSVGSFYDASRPEVFITKVKGYVEMYKSGEMDAVYGPLMQAWDAVIQAADAPVETKQEPVQKPAQQSTPPVEKKVVEKKTESTPAPAQSKRVGSTTSSTIDMTKQVKQETKPVKEKPVATVVEKKEEVRKTTTKKSKISINDHSSKSIKFNAPSEVFAYMENTLTDLARTFLIQSGQLSDEELSEISSKSNTSVFRNHNLTLTRTDQMMILMYLSLSYLNITFTDDVIRESFAPDNDKGLMKLKFYQFMVEANLVELEIQSDVKRLVGKINRNNQQNERIEAMLGLLLLERANVPKDVNRDTMKGFLDTSSIMNYGVDGLTLVEGVVSSKVQSVKDYKKINGG